MLKVNATEWVLSFLNIQTVHGCKKVTPVDTLATLNLKTDKLLCILLLSHRGLNSRKIGGPMHFFKSREGGGDCVCFSVIAIKIPKKAIFNENSKTNFKI